MDTMKKENLDPGRRKPAIRELTSAVVDNGRRGEPLPGCDCEQCFGHCMINRELVEREARLRNQVDEGDDDA